MKTAAHSFYFSLVLSLCMVNSKVLAQQDWQQSYKVGDAIEFLIAEGIWQKGVVSENIPGGTLRVIREDSGPGDYRNSGSIYIVYGKNEIRKFTEKATPPAPTHPAAIPPQKNSPANNLDLVKQKPPQAQPGANEAYFKRLIYEYLRDIHPQLQTGVVFHDFAVAESYFNQVVDDVPRHMTAAAGAMIYRIRTSHDVLVQYTDAILKTKVVEGYFIISQDKAGNWFAAPDGQESWTQEHLPLQ